MKADYYYDFPLTITEETFKVRQELNDCLIHILTQVAIKAQVNLTQYPFDEEPFDSDYIAMAAIDDIFETDKDIIIYIKPSSHFWDVYLPEHDFWDVYFPDHDLPDDYDTYTTWETDYLGHHFTFWLDNK